MDPEPFSRSGRVIVYGGKGALGSAIVSHFKLRNWWVVSIDMKGNEQADANVVVQPKDNWVEQYNAVMSDLGKILGRERIHCVICVAGGWSGADISSSEVIASCDSMWKQSVWPSVISANIAAKYMVNGGCLALTGAKVALMGTPGMIGYGMAKAAVHQLVLSLGEEKSGLPEGSFVVGILPITLDTPINRKVMSTSDFTSWTPITFVAELLFQWATKIDRPQNGSLVKLETVNGNTKLVFV